MTGVAYSEFSHKNGILRIARIIRVKRGKYRLEFDGDVFFYPTLKSAKAAMALFWSISP